MSQSDAGRAGEMSIADILNKAADLIEPEGAWTQYANARDRKGRRTSVSSDEAVCFCMAGAIIRASDGAYPKEAVTPVLRDPENGRDWLVAFNDAPERTQAEAVAKLREAAMLAARSNQGDQ